MVNLSMRLFVILTAVSGVLAVPLPQQGMGDKLRVGPGWDSMPVKIPKEYTPPSDAEVERGRTGNPVGPYPGEDRGFPILNLPGVSPAIPDAEEPSAFDLTGDFFGGLQKGADLAQDGLDFAGKLTGVAALGAAYGATLNLLNLGEVNPLQVAPDTGFLGGRN